MLEQRGDHACSEWNDQGCLFGGRRGMTVAEILLLVSGYYSDAHGCSNQTIDAKQRCRSTLGWAFFFFRSSIVWWWKVNVACVSTTMIHNAYVSIGTLIFYFISNPKQFFLFLIWCYLLRRISYFGCSKHHVQFSLMLRVVTIILVCFTLVVPSPCILPFFWLSS